MPGAEQQMAKARVATADRDGNAVSGTEFEVQFNPSTLKVQTRTNVEGGRTRGRPRRSQNGVNTATLSVERVFDTTDDGTTEDPLPVQTLTGRFRRFVEPPGRGSNKPPQPIWFHWGEFTFTGVVESLDEELELFSVHGVALRATVGLSITQQDFVFEATRRGQGARDDQGADGGEDQPSGTGTAADRPGAPGTAGNGRGEAAAESLSGESAADFARRNGLPADAWRAVTGPAVPDPLDLPAGLEIPFPRSLSLGAGVSARIGIGAGIDISVEAAARAGLGLGETAGPDPRALGDGGGVEAPVDALRAAEATTAADRARRAHPGPVATGGGGRTSATVTGAGATTRPGIDAPSPGDRSPAGRRVDARAVTYGRGVPLRPRPADPNRDQAA
ncbi:MAG: hypothetical protein ACK5PP_12320, partial [Acidimicrobiales bacterium]